MNNIDLQTVTLEVNLTFNMQVSALTNKGPNAPCGVKRRNPG